MRIVGYLVVVRSKVPPPWVPSHETNNESRIVVRWKVTVKDCVLCFNGCYWRVERVRQYSVQVLDAVLCAGLTVPLKLKLSVLKCV